MATTEGIRTGTVIIQGDGGREFLVLWAAPLKLRAPNDVQTNRVEMRLVLESLRERVE